MDSAVARSATDSIHGIASDIFCAAVGSALNSSYGGTAGPRSPHASSTHVRTDSMWTQCTMHGTSSSIATENLLASNDLFAPPNLPPSVGAAPATADSEDVPVRQNGLAGSGATQCKCEARSGPEAVGANDEDAILACENSAGACLDGQPSAAPEAAKRADNSRHHPLLGTCSLSPAQLPTF
jgi:hypothetical protein